MEILRIGAHFSAFIHSELGANVGLIHTPQGLVLIDTTSYPSEMETLLDATGTNRQNIQLVINTHSHSDHTWGNQLFDCTILSHRLCLEQMRSSLQNEWRPEELQAYIRDLHKTDPQKAEMVRQNIKGLHIRLPDQVFEERYNGVLGGVHYELIHLGGHTPDLSVVWMPEDKVLYASDLIFVGRYPYIFDADIPRWLMALKQLREFEAEVIIPGHGPRCGEAEINVMQDYLQVSWELVSEHVRLGHQVDETLEDNTFPVFPGEKYERLHEANIRYMYNKFLRANKP